MERSENQLADSSDSDLKVGPVFIFGTGRCGSTHLQRLISLNSKVWVWGEHGGFLDHLFKALAAYENSEDLKTIVFNPVLPDNDGLLLQIVRDEAQDLSWLNRIRPQSLRAELRELIERLFSRGIPEGWVGWGFKEPRYAKNDVPAQLIEMFPECSAAFTFREPAATLASMIRSWFPANRIEHGRIDDIRAIYDNLARHWLETMTYFVALKKSQPAKISILEIGQLGCAPEALLKLLRVQPRDPTPRISPKVTNSGPPFPSVAAERAILTCFEFWRDETLAVYEAALRIRDFPGTG